MSGFESSKDRLLTNSYYKNKFNQVGLSEEGGEHDPTRSLGNPRPIRTHTKFKINDPSKRLTRITMFHDNPRKIYLSRSSRRSFGL